MEIPTYEKTAEAFRELHEMRRLAGMSALPPPDPQGSCERSRLATGSESVPVCELLRLAGSWREHAKSMTAGSKLKLALDSCAMDLHRLADSWTERQPTPNGADQPRPRE